MVVMSKVLLLYCSNDGQTFEIVSRIGERLKDVIPFEMQDLRQNAVQDLSRYRAVLIGAAIRYGHFHHDVRAFAEKHALDLNRKPSAFVCVCLTARKPEKRSPQSNVYLRKFLAKTLWKPAMATAVAGALFYPRYRWYDRWAIRLIMRMTGGETDTRKEVVYTDWRQVDDFADNFSQIVG